MFGYKVEDVDAFFTQVADEYQRLCEENEILEQKINTLANKVEEYRNDENSLRSILIEAKRLGDSIIVKAKEQAEMIVKEAKVAAENVITRANGQISREQNTLLQLQKEVSSFKSKVKALYNTHLNMLSSLPDVSGEVGEVDLRLNAGEFSAGSVGVSGDVSEQMERPGDDEPVTRRLNLGEGAANLSGDEAVKKRFIDVNTNENGDLVSKYGILKFGEKHRLTSDDKLSPKKKAFFKK
jgi:cell division initiation protein